MGSITLALSQPQKKTQVVQGPMLLWFKTSRSLVMGQKNFLYCCSI